MDPQESLCEQRLKTFNTFTTCVWGSLSGPVEYTGPVKPAQDTFGI